MSIDSNALRGIEKPKGRKNEFVRIERPKKLNNNLQELKSQTKKKKSSE